MNLKMTEKKISKLKLKKLFSKSPVNSSADASSSDASEEQSKKSQAQKPDAEVDSGVKHNDALSNNDTVCSINSKSSHGPKSSEDGNDEVSSNADPNAKVENSTQGKASETQESMEKKQSTERAEIEKSEGSETSDKSVKLANGAVEGTPLSQTDSGEGKSSKYSSSQKETLDAASETSLRSSPGFIAMDLGFDEEGLGSPFRANEEFEPLGIVHDFEEPDKDDITSMLPISAHNNTRGNDLNSFYSAAGLSVHQKHSRKNSLLGEELESQIGTKTVDYGDNVRVSSRGLHTFVVMDKKLFEDREEALIRLLGDSKYSNFNQSYTKNTKEETGREEAESKSPKKVDSKESASLGDKKETETQEEALGKKATKRRKLVWDRVLNRMPKKETPVQ